MGATTTRRTVLWVAELRRLIHSRQQFHGGLERREEEAQLTSQPCGPSKSVVFICIQRTGTGLALPSMVDVIRPTLRSFLWQTLTLSEGEAMVPLKTLLPGSDGSQEAAAGSKELEKRGNSTPRSHRVPEPAGSFQNQGPNQIRAK